MRADEYRFRIYLFSNRSNILYIGMTNGLRKRVTQHRELGPWTFTARYRITRLVHYEYFHSIANGMTRE